jgi:hypothetical protein
MFFDFEDGRPDIAPVGQEVRPHDKERIVVFGVGPISLQIAMGGQRGRRASRIRRSPPRFSPT